MAALLIVDGLEAYTHLETTNISFPAQPIYLKSRARCKKRRVWQPNGFECYLGSRSQAPG
jgi:hypothetical protein